MLVTYTFICCFLGTYVNSTNQWTYEIYLSIKQQIKSDIR